MKYIKEKGFTLIELLAVIVILAVILAIAVPSIANLIDNAKINAFISDEKLMIKAVKTYLGVNSNYLPSNIGQSNEVTLSTLQANNYIGTITSPSDKSKTCNGYVLITKIDASNYDYNPFLNCENNIGSLSEDGLIAYYPFDDYQEPTTNLINYPVITKNAGVGVLPTGWGIADTSQTYGTLEYGILDDGVNDAKSLYSLINANNWQNHFQIVWNLSPFDPNKYYTFSVWGKCTKLSNDPFLQFDFQGLDATSTRVDYQKKFYFKKENEWELFSVTVRPSDFGAVSFAGNMKIYPYADTYANGAVQFSLSSPQMEAKEYASNFTSGTRTGAVKDYSGNGNNGTLTLANTPKWIIDTDRGGAYQFDGIDDYFDIGASGNTGISDYMTIATWVKFDNVDSTARVGVVVGNFPKTLSFSLEGYTNGNMRFWWNNGEKDMRNTIDLRGAWHHVVLVRNKITDRSTMYIDGKVDFEYTSGTNILFDWPFRIGNDYRTAPGVPYHGLIADIKIYKRALSGDEVKQLYNTEK